jgi:hypothetical protein
MSDITLETKLTDELATKRRKFKGAFEHSQVGLVDENGFWIDSNKNYVLSGYSKNRVTIINLY